MSKIASFLECNLKTTQQNTNTQYSARTANLKGKVRKGKVR